MYKAKIFDIQTNTETWRDLSDDEIKQIEDSQKLSAEYEVKQATKAAARQAVLDKLGLTAEEMAALLP